MKKQILLTLILCMSVILSAQEKIDRGAGADGGIKVFQGQVRINSSGRKFSFAYAQGDKIILKFTTHKDKKLKYVALTDSHNRKLWQKDNFASYDDAFTISKEDVYTFEFVAKGMGARDVTLEIIRMPQNPAQSFNTAWMKYPTYIGTEVNYTVDSMAGYKPAVVSEKELKIFDQYVYQDVEMYNKSTQVLGQAGIHNSQAKLFKMDLDPNKVPKNAKLKGYSYSVSSVLGGAKHWAIADITVSVGALFLSPAAGFAAHGAMALIGPQPGNEPVMYYISNRESDYGRVKEIFRPYNDGRKVTNAYKEGIGTVVGLINKNAGNAVKGTKVHVRNEGDLDFNQKGKVTNMFMYSATPPINKWMIMANPEYTQAKNVKMKGSAIYYAPKFKKVKAKQYHYDLNIIPVEKTAMQYTKSVSWESIK